MAYTIYTETKSTKTPEMCISLDGGKCNHEAYKGADCSKDPTCILWVGNGIFEELEKPASKQPTDKEVLK